VGGENQESWKDLCRQALRTEDDDELLGILLRLDQALKDEQDARRALRNSPHPKNSRDLDAQISKRTL